MNLTYCQNNKFFPNQAHNVHEQVQLISILALSSQMILESSDIWETTKSFRNKGLIYDVTKPLEGIYILVCPSVQASKKFIDTTLFNNYWHG